ncbi:MULTISPECIES: cytochrome P450 [Actinosynnema]|uniref:cytochrome P450 family protein n=1 Tax=Actinosynnema TaxID=40566 RepID=UPI0020A24797|nr:cytochrome P450 [Actinosynnema pretiosum]MCP2098638.1 hypothetical protein [Actinosynnema pretiosum]
MTVELPESKAGGTLPAEFCTRPGPNPYPSYAAAREQSPVHPIDYPNPAEAYVVTDYETVVQAFTDPRLSKSVDNAPGFFRDALRESSPVLIKNMLTSDPPKHTRLRKLLGNAFVPRRLKLLRPRVQEITDDLIDALPETGVVDLYNDFALPLPMRVICEFLGVPPEDRDVLHDWGMVLSNAPYADEEGNRRLKEASEGIESYLLAHMSARRADPREDLTSVVLRSADEEGGGYTDDEIVSTLVLLVIAGHKTTSNLIGNGTQALLRHPEQFRLLLDRPELVTTAIEEFLRYEGPVYRAPQRFASEDMDIAGHPVGRNSVVHLMLNSANRDPAVFEDPDRLDITRKPNRHLSFGYSVHFCPGAPLSRVEGDVAFTTLLRRLPGLRLAVPDDQVPWRYDNSASRGVERLPITYDRRLPR